MKLLLSILVTLYLSVASGFAQTGSIENTIQNQFNAFQANDPAMAFEFASPFIQRQFSGPEHFGKMVKNGFPMVWNSGEIRFLEQRNIAGVIWQKVMVQDKKGRIHMLAYQMINQAGSWRINGVQILNAVDANA
ncbi:MAG: DUF4864 domain-containing protein [Paracoccaceae bacterium]|nr:hypothetical protein RB2150_15535 [Rhodobacterales bacterium HTCC2150] [Rhodobacteraceae bacterium HTCC2150]MDG1530160.1 DUF4864 domain-containing protein [Paracoccaceae bacterium]